MKLKHLMMKYGRGLEQTERGGGEGNTRVNLSGETQMKAVTVRNRIPKPAMGKRK